METMNQRVFVVDEAIKDVIFSDAMQIRGLYMHHNVCAWNAPKNMARRTVWRVCGCLEAIERELPRLLRRHRRDLLTHKGVWEFLTAAGMTISGMSEAEARATRTITPSSDPDGRTNDDAECTLMLRFEYTSAAYPIFLFVSNMTLARPYRKSSPPGRLTMHDVPNAYCPELDMAKVQDIFARASVSAATQHLATHLLDTERALAGGADQAVLCSIAEATVATVPHVCDECGADARRVCTGCRFIRYCTPACQNRAWRTVHKRMCMQYRLLCNFVALEANTPTRQA